MQRRSAPSSDSSEQTLLQGMYGTEDGEGNVLFARGGCVARVVDLGSGRAYRYIYKFGGAT